MNQYLEILEKKGNSLMIYKEGQLIFESSLKGIRPYLIAIDDFGVELEGSLVVDKILGRAAAFLVIYSKAAKAIAAIVSTPGRTLLEKFGINLIFEEEVPHIKMKNGVIFCPFERMVQGIEDPIEAYEAIFEKMKSFTSS